MENRSPGGKVTITPKVGRKHTVAPSNGEGTLVANLLEEADYEGSFDMRLGTSLTGSHAKKGVQLGRSGLKNEIVLNVQAGDNKTRRECIVKIPRGTGTPEEYKDRLANVLWKKSVKPIEPVLSPVDGVVGNTKPVAEQRVELTPPLTQGELEYILGLIDEIEGTRTSTAIADRIRDDNTIMLGRSVDYISEHMIRPLLVQGLMLEDSSGNRLSYRLSTAGKALIGADKTSAPDPISLETPTLSMEKLAELEAIIRRARDAGKKLDEIDREINSLQSKTILLNAEAKEQEMILNDSDIPIAQTKLDQIREILS